MLDRAWGHIGFDAPGQRLWGKIVAQLGVQSDPIDPLIDEQIPLVEIEPLLDDLLGKGEHGLVRAVDVEARRRALHDDLHVCPLAGN